MSKVVIIGGGASGLVAAIKASKNNEVILLEKNNNCGKKILITGNGKCNYFNEDFTINHYNCSNMDILSNIITDENKKRVLSFFNNIGIEPKIKDGYYYPFSNQAVTIQNGLVLEAKNNNVKIMNNLKVDDIKYDGKFKVITDKSVIICDKVVLATGSKAASITGSDGFGYNIAKNFGHTINKVLPALVQIKLDEKYLKDWAGIRNDVIVSLYEDNKKVKEEYGEIQLTNYGLSGICVFQLSGFVSKALEKNKKVEIEINFLPYLEENNVEELINYIEKRNKNIPQRNIVELFEGMLNYKLIRVILKKIGIKDYNSWDDLSNKEKETLVSNLISFKVKVCGTNDFENAQVCTGGVPLSEINIETMESLKQNNLYIIGELLDVDGNCGGYNLAFAWLSGIIVGEKI